MPTRLAAHVVALALLVTPLLVVTPVEAQQRTTPTVSVAVSTSHPTAGEALRFAGTVSGRSRGALLTLQLKSRERGSWQVVEVGKVRRSGSYRLTTRAVEGFSTYRVLVQKSRHLRRATSPVVGIVAEAPDTTPLSAYSLTRLRREVSLLIDTYRDEHGLDYPSADADLHDYAQSWSAHQSRQGEVLTRADHDDAPFDYVVTAEHTVLSGTPEELMRDLEADAAQVLQAEAMSFGIGMSLRDDEVGYWTITFANLPPEHGPWTEDEVRQLVLADTNEYRAAHGLSPVQLMPELDVVAQTWTQHMADDDVIEHNPDVTDQIPEGWKRAGENIAGGYAPDDVVEGWYASPGHRGNMLGDYTHLGIGYAANEEATHRHYYTQVFAKY